MDACSIDRRRLLAGSLGSIGAVAGYTTLRTASRGGSTVSLLAAGSLNHCFRQALLPAVDPQVHLDARGSAAIARMIAAGQRDPDLLALADVALFASPLDTEWFAEFATNAIVLAYDPATPGGRAIEAAGSDGWYRPVLEDEVRLGRTDPDLDPLGYRTLFALELATEYYDTDADLRDTIPSRDQVYPETQLVSRFETGAIDAAITYRNMAVERGYEYVDLPPEIDLGDPARRDHYARATYELPGGTVVRGGLISYGATVLHRSPAARDVFDFQLSELDLESFGFGVPEQYPQYTGNVPPSIAN
jgi:molybdate/tungstate transport system substrate-binding protein